MQHDDTATVRQVQRCRPWRCIEHIACIQILANLSDVAGLLPETAVELRAMTSRS
jgi:hypothetical protein